MNSIFAGLGVPPTLTGLAGNGGGFTNNFISLKTLTERLQYGRDHLTGFWEKEVEYVRKAMGFRKPATIVYDQMSLSDEAAEKNLLIQLADRDIISNETVLERFKEVPGVEKVRLQREDKARDKDKMPPKAGPFHQPESDDLHEKDMEKIDRQGEITEKVAVEKEKNKPKPAAPQGGRPQNKMDTNKRKKRVDTPKSKPGVAELSAWAFNTYHSLDDIANGYLAYVGKKNKRQLTKAQVQEIADIKLRVLSNIPIMTKVNNQVIQKVLAANAPAPQVLLTQVENAGISLENNSMQEYDSSIVGLYIGYCLKS